MTPDQEREDMARRLEEREAQLVRLESRKTTLRAEISMFRAGIVEARAEQYRDAPAWLRQPLAMLHDLDALAAQSGLDPAEEAERARLEALIFEDA